MNSIDRFLWQVFDQIEIETQKTFLHENFRLFVERSILFGDEIVSERIDEINDEEDLIVVQRASVIKRFVRLNIGRIVLIRLRCRCAGRGVGRHRGVQHRWCCCAGVIGERVVVHRSIDVIDLR